MAAEGGPVDQRIQSLGRGWREMTPSAEPCFPGPPPTRLFDARQKLNSNHEPAQVVCM